MSKYTKLVSLGLNIFGFIKISLNNLSLQNVKDRVNTIIKQTDQKIIIIIDNIDRLSPEDILYVFKLVNSVSNFKKLLFILSFDKDVVNKKIQDKVKDSLYLEKFIQIDQSVPKILPENILSYIEKDLIKIYKYFDEKIDNYSFAYLNYFGSYFTNLREVKKYTNIVNFDIAGISKKKDNRINKKDIYLTDFLILEILKTFFLTIYDDIYLNPDIYITIDKKVHLYQKSLYSDIGKGKSLFERTTLNHLLESIDIKYKECVFSIICLLFPNIYDLADKNRALINKEYSNIYIGLMPFNSENTNKDSINSRICSEDSLYRYFTMKISKKDIHNREIRYNIELINNGDEKDIFNIFLKFQDRSLFMDKLAIPEWGLTKEGSVNLIKMICNNILKLQESTKDNKLYINFIKNLLNNHNQVNMLSENEIINIFKNIYSIINKDNFYFMVSLYNNLNLYNGGQILYKPEIRIEINKIVNTFIDKTKYNAFKNNNSKDFFYALYLWLGNSTTIDIKEKENNSIHIKKYIHKFVIDKKSLIKLIEFLKKENYLENNLKNNEIFDKQILNNLAEKILKEDKSLTFNKKNLIKWFISWNI